MKINIDKKAFVELVNVASRGAATRSAVPAMMGIKLEAKGDNLLATGSDGEIYIEATGKAEVYKEGVAVVASKVLSSIANKLPEVLTGVDIELNDNGSQLNLKCGSTDLNLATYPAENFVNEPVIEEGTDVLIDGSYFKEIKNKVAFAVSSDITSPTFTGILFDFDSEGLNVVATDKYRLSLYQIPSVKLDKKVSIIVPVKGVLEALKLLNGSISMAVGKSHVEFKGEDTQGIRLLSRTIQGDFPNYKGVINLDASVADIQVSSKELADVLLRASCIAENDSVVNFKLSHQLNIKSTSQVGSVNEYIEAKKFEGEELDIYLNSNFFVDGLNALDEEDATIKFAGQLSPVYFVGKNYVSLMLPVRK